jgi:hypothetical protein
VPPKPVPFETLHGGSAIRFLGSVYATAQNIFNMTREAGQGSGSAERIGGYDQFIYLLFCILEIIYVSYIHLCCFIFTNDFILSVLSYYNMIDLSVLILQSYYLCFYLFISSCSVSIHVYRIYMIYIIHMLYVLLIHIGMDQFNITISMVNYLYVIIIMLIYGIKIIRKMPIFLTVNGEEPVGEVERVVVLDVAEDTRLSLAHGVALVASSKRAAHQLFIYDRNSESELRSVKTDMVRPAADSN